MSKGSKAAAPGGLHAGLLAEKEIRTSGGSFVVRGVGPDAIVDLFRRRGSELSALYDRLVAKGDGSAALSLDQASELGKLLLTEAPTLAAEVIAMAAGPVDEETIAIARALPFPVQLAAIEAVAELTFTSDMPPKKVIEAVARAMSGLTGTLAALKA